jgi:FecR protein
MKKRTGFSLAVLAMAILLLCQIVQPAGAQDQDLSPPEPPNASQPGQLDQDPPTRAGRISFSEGSVSFQPGGQGDWVAAVPNRPLTTGDNLWVDKDSRAEIQIGGTSIRLGPETSVTFLDLGDNVTQLRLSLGSLYFRVRHFGSDDSFEVDTPNLAFNVNQPGEFRLDVNQNGDQAVATVWHGAGEISGNGNSYRLTEGQQGTFSGTDQLTYDVSDIQSPDDFGRWCLSRDQREDHARSRQYVSDDMTGYEDLDDYGQWRSDPDYGYVWAPTTVAVGWAPYRFGHWAYVYPWGWTWVEDEPWGFAPFHYGRWAFVRGGWCWVPGPVAVRPVYAPALVAFVGGISISVGTAPVGWFPLAPREVYVPWYRTSPRYVQNVNVTNTHVTVVQVTNVYNNYNVNHVTNVTYVNQRVANSVTVVNRDTFVNARPVHNNLVRVDERAMASARVSTTVVTQVQPARQSVIGVARPVAFHPPVQALNRPVVGTRQPVAFNRPAGTAPQFARPVAPAPVRTVRAVPPTQAQSLQRGARGGPAYAGPVHPGGQPNAPQNNGFGGRPGGPAGQPNAPDNRGYVPRPGAPVAQPNAPENRGAAPRPEFPAGQQNPNAPRPSGPANGAMPNGPENSARPGIPQYGNRNVPRPTAGPQNSTPEQPQRQYPGTRPENNRPEYNQPPQQQSRPVETPQWRPENNRPEYNQQPQSPRQVQPPQSRPENMRPPEETPRTMPQQPTRAPEARPEPSPRQPDTRPMPPSSQERNAPRSEVRPAAPSEHESRPAPAPHEEKPQHEERPQKDEKPSKGNREAKFR